MSIDNSKSIEPLTMTHLDWLKWTGDTAGFPLQITYSLESYVQILIFQPIPNTGQIYIMEEPKTFMQIWSKKCNLNKLVSYKQTH
jgi:hypothetical protein